MATSELVRAHPPETLEGWYALHQIFTVDHARAGLRDQVRGGDTTPTVEASPQQLQADSSGGWSAWARLIGSKADLMAIHFAPTLDAIGDSQSAMREWPGARSLRLEYSFLSVTEAGLYHLTAELAR